MKKLSTLAGLFLTMAIALVPANAQTSDRCQNANGKGVWTLIPTSPGEVLGRVLGPTSGTLKGSVSAYLTNLIPKADGSFEATSIEVWMLGPQDLIIFSGRATFTPIPGEPVGTVADSLTLTAIGGTGLYTGATGTVEVKGIGRNLFGPAAAPGNTFFEIAYKGTVCRGHL